jgi:hypothetical protein
MERTNGSATSARGRQRWMRTKPAFAYMSVGNTKGYQLIKEKRIRAVKLDGITIIDMDSVDELMNALPCLET